MPFERRYYIFMGFPMSISGFIEDWGQIRYCWVNTIESMVATVWIDFRPSQDPLDHVLPQFQPSTCFWTSCRALVGNDHDDSTR